jgi:signal transduction histidine kinase
MRLQARLRATTAASTGAVLLLAGVLTWSVREFSRADDDVELTRTLVREQYERSLARDDYLLSQGDRALVQWEARTAEIPVVLAQARDGGRFGGPAEQQLMAEMETLLARGSALFREIVERDRAPLAGQPEPALGAALRLRSTMALRILGHDLYARAQRLEALTVDRLDATQRQTMVILVVLLVVVITVTVINSGLVAAVLQRRILLLHDGAERIAAGNLDHRIGVAGSDELAELGRSFDAMAERLQRSYAALEVSNRELEAFSYAVSHDLRAPLRSVSGFSQAALEDYGPKLDDRGRQYLTLASEAAREMGQLIDDLLGLSRVGRAEMARQRVDLSAMARAIVEELRLAQPERRVELEVTPDLVVTGDPTLLRLVMENLLSNAWKFTAHHDEARIRVGQEPSRGRDAYFVADDGAGFDMAYVEKLFQPFQRLHRTSEFPGTGVGLATVHRILRRHGGEAWATGAVEKGATIHFTLPEKEEPHADQGHPAR